MMKSSTAEIMDAGDLRRRTVKRNAIDDAIRHVVQEIGEYEETIGTCFVLTEGGYVKGIVLVDIATIGTCFVLTEGGYVKGIVLVDIATMV
ncbi:hypothetical protein LOK49_LG02G02880 [Camellia lanceoleosa]|uniref:Uncharacterized protein n=1 Tax=Camellia lanceoleosa TaxID=1840588 RepID=A0ACC0IJE8_9ERIC|nr:hypothetical protein LOK49_LG02G02880 [Camellia lanceoleosa]